MNTHGFQVYLMPRLSQDLDRDDGIGISDDVG